MLPAGSDDYEVNFRVDRQFEQTFGPFQKGGLVAKIALGFQVLDGLVGCQADSGRAELPDLFGQKSAATPGGEANDFKLFGVAANHVKCLRANRAGRTQQSNSFQAPNLSLVMRPVTNSPSRNHYSKKRLRNMFRISQGIYGRRRAKVAVKG